MIRRPWSRRGKKRVHDNLGFADWSLGIGR